MALPSKVVNSSKVVDHFGYGGYPGAWQPNSLPVARNTVAQGYNRSAMVSQPETTLPALLRTPPGVFFTPPGVFKPKEPPTAKHVKREEDQDAVWIPAELDSTGFGSDDEPWLVKDSHCGAMGGKRRLPKGVPVKKQIPAWCL